MEHWKTLSNEDKIQRLADYVHILQKRVEKLTDATGIDDMPGYTTLKITTTVEGEDRALGVYRL